MDIPSKGLVVLVARTLAMLVVLALLYFAFILRDWHYIEDVKSMVIPFVVFGLFSGSLLSVMLFPQPTSTPWSALIVFVAAALIPKSAICMQLF